MQSALSILISLATLVGLVVHCLRDKATWVSRRESQRLADHAQQLEMRVAILERKRE